MKYYHTITILTMIVTVRIILWRKRMRTMMIDDDDDAEKGDH